MSRKYRQRRLIAVLVLLLTLTVSIIQNTPKSETSKDIDQTISNVKTSLALDALKTLKIKGRAPKTDYSREKFGADWSKISGCSMRNIILNRDLDNVNADLNCNVTSGVLNDPYTGKIINFKRGSDSSSDIQIDHVVALADAWQKGAQLLLGEKRIELANDPLELLAVDGNANQQKGGGDAATWLPPNKAFRCQYVARQIAVKQKYELWVTQAEYDAMSDILQKCPNEMLPTP